MNIQLMSTVKVNWEGSIKVIEYNIGKAFVELCNYLDRKDLNSRQKQDIVETFQYMISSGCDYIMLIYKLNGDSRRKYRYYTDEFKEAIHSNQNVNSENDCKEIQKEIDRNPNFLYESVDNLKNKFINEKVEKNNPESEYEIAMKEALSSFEKEANSKIPNDYHIETNEEVSIDMNNKEENKIQ